MEIGYNGGTPKITKKGEGMKQMPKRAGIAAVAGWILLGSATWAADCGRGYMKDPCARDSYSVVETEKFVRGPHNCMAIAHYFPGEEPEGYCGHYGYKGKNAVRAVSPVASVE
jgi:hypothetical protein